MLEDVIIYMIFLIFLTIINIVGYLKIPIMSMICLAITMLLVVGAFSAFVDYALLAFAFIIMNAVLAFMGLARATRS